LPDGSAGRVVDVVAYAAPVSDSAELAPPKASATYVSDAAEPVIV